MATQAAAKTDTTAVAVPKPADAIKTLLTKARAHLLRVMPTRVDPDRFIQIAVNACVRTPKLLTCDKLSILSAAMDAAQLGLVLDGVLGQAYLVPFWDKRLQRNRAQMIAGYRGYIMLMHRGPFVSTVMAETVYEGDEFEFEFGTNEFLRHKPKPGLNRHGADGLLYSYCVVTMKDGTKTFLVLDRTQIDDARASSKAADSGPWVDHYGAMALKTAIRRKAKTTPLSPEAALAAVKEEYAEAGVSTTVSLEETTDDELAALARDVKKEDDTARREDLKARHGVKGAGETVIEPAMGVDPEVLSPEELAALDAKDAREPGQD